MAVNVNNVYQTVLYILNKEQRGYMTPGEFNNVAAQVQQSIFEKYFEDLNQYMRGPQVENEYADRVKNLEEKISNFETSQPLALATGVGSIDSLTPAVHRIGTFEYQPRTGSLIELQYVSHHQLNLIRRSKLTQPTLHYPVYVLDQGAANYEITVYPNTISNITCNYIKKPENPIWAFNVNGVTGAYEYVAPGGVSQFPVLTGSVPFEISNQDKTELIIGILLYAGVIIRDPSIVNIAADAIRQEEISEKS
jgi:hypothetical protein